MDADVRACAKARSSRARLGSVDAGTGCGSNWDRQLRSRPDGASHDTIRVDLPSFLEGGGRRPSTGTQRQATHRSADHPKHLFPLPSQVRTGKRIGFAKSRPIVPDDCKTASARAMRAAPGAMGAADGAQGSAAGVIGRLRPRNERSGGEGDTTGRPWAKFILRGIGPDVRRVGEHPFHVSKRLAGPPARNSTSRRGSRRPGRGFFTKANLTCPRECAPAGGARGAETQDHEGTSLVFAFSSLYRPCASAVETV